MRAKIAIGFVFAAQFLSAADAPSPSTLVEKGHYKRAEAALSARLKQNPNDEDANCTVSKVSVAFQRWDEAIQQAEKAVAADGKRADYHAQLADALVSKLSRSDAGMFAKMSLSSRFRKEAELALQFDPKNEDANLDLVEFYLEAPGIAGGSKSKAQDLAESVLKSDPAQGNFLKGEIASHEKQPAEAEQYYRKAILAAPAKYEYRAALANLLLNQGKEKYALAEDQARQSLKVDPERVTAYTVLAVVYSAQGRWKDLESILADSERQVPDDLGPHYQAAKALLTTGDANQLGRAESLLRRYLSQPAEGTEPSLAAAHWRLGLVMEKEGHKDDARKEVQTAVSLDPTLKPAQDDLKRLK